MGALLPSGFWLASLVAPPPPGLRSPRGPFPYLGAPSHGGGVSGPQTSRGSCHEISAPEPGFKTQVLRLVRLAPQDAFGQKGSIWEVGCPYPPQEETLRYASGLGPLMDSPRWPPWGPSCPRPPGGPGGACSFGMDDDPLVQQEGSTGKLGPGRGLWAQPTQGPAHGLLHPGPWTPGLLWGALPAVLWGTSWSRRLPPKCQLFREPGLGYRDPCPGPLPRPPLTGTGGVALCPGWLCLPLELELAYDSVFVGDYRPRGGPLSWDGLPRTPAASLCQSISDDLPPFPVHSLDLPLNHSGCLLGPSLARKQWQLTMCISLLGQGLWPVGAPPLPSGFRLASLVAREPRLCALCPTPGTLFTGSSTQLVSHRASHGDPSSQL